MMPNLITELNQHVFSITFNRLHKHNAFDDVFLRDLQQALNVAEQDPAARVILLKAAGPHFSAGADLNWMQRMANLDYEENLTDARVLACVMASIYHSVKPTMAMVQGHAFGGGAGLVAACDIAIAASSAHFCFSEVKLGLIPAVISPYVIKAVGERIATGLFMSAELFDAKRALALNLIHYCINDDELCDFTYQLAHKIAQLPPIAVGDAKALVRQVANHPIDEQLQHLTAHLIAKKRVSAEGQEGLKAFLNKP